MQPSHRQGVPSETWETYENLKNIDAFHHCCATNKLDLFSPKLTPQFSASVPNMSRRTATGQFTFPPVEPTVPVTTQPTTTFNSSVRRTRGSVLVSSLMTSSVLIYFI
jgi:hypothetical protein